MKRKLKVIFGIILTGTVLMTEATAVMAAPNRYIVEKGDNLIKIAKSIYGNPLDYISIYEENSDIIRDPDLIFIGQEFNMPGNNASGQSTTSGGITKSGKDATSGGITKSGKDATSGGITKSGKTASPGETGASFKVVNNTEQTINRLMVGFAASATRKDVNILKEDLAPGAFASVKLVILSEEDCEDSRYSLFAFDEKGGNSGIYTFFYPVEREGETLTINWDPAKHRYIFAWEG